MTLLFTSMAYRQYINNTLITEMTLLFTSVENHTSYGTGVWSSPMKVTSRFRKIPYIKITKENSRSDTTYHYTFFLQKKHQQGEKAANCIFNIKYTYLKQIWTNWLLNALSKYMTTAWYINWKSWTNKSYTETTKFTRTCWDTYKTFCSKFWMITNYTLRKIYNWHPAEKNLEIFKGFT